MSKWIECTDSLPPTNEKVIFEVEIVDERNILLIGEYNSNQKYWVTDWPNYMFCDDDKRWLVKRWVNLPEGSV